MNVLFIILNKTDYLEDVLSAFVDLGVKGATILDSQGMANAIVKGQYKSIAFFGSLKNYLMDAHPYNKTIFTVIHNEALLEKTMQAVNEIMKKTNEKGSGGIMFTVPIGSFHTFD